jgi:hypothetical protein
MTIEEIRSEFTPIFRQAQAVLEEKRFFEVSFAVGDDLERQRFTTTEEAFEAYNVQVGKGNRDVAVSAKTEKIEFRGASYYPFLLALFNTFQSGRVVPTTKWPYKKIHVFNERVLTALTKAYVESLKESDGKKARTIRAELIAETMVAENTPTLA